MSEILVFGIDGRGLSEEHELLLRQCAVIVGSKRLADRVEAKGFAVAPITPLAAAFERIDAGLLQGHVGVLASGDPLFYGIGARIIERFGSERVRILPALSSLQEAFCRFKLSWTDAAVVSLHGRKQENIPGLLLRHRKTFIFTDPSRPPEMLAKTLIEYLTAVGETSIKNGCRVHVAEDLGSIREKITVASLEEISHLQFSPLNVVCLLLPELPPPPVFGLEEKEIAHNRGLITKDEVRAATLHRLRLPRKGVFWDIGGGSGSVSLEAAAMLPELSVYTVEHKEEELANIRDNICRFGLFNITPVQGRAKERIALLPDPDAVFIGGSGGEMQEIIAVAAARLGAGGRLVANGVTEETVEKAPRFMEQSGLQVESSRIEVHRSGPEGSRSFNPITIMVGRK